MLRGIPNRTLSSLSGTWWLYEDDEAGLWRRKVSERREKVKGQGPAKKSCGAGFANPTREGMTRGDARTKYWYE